MGSWPVLNIGFKEILSYLLTVSKTVEQIAKDALSLPPEARALLADKLVASLDTTALSRIDQAWLSEAKRRQQEIRSGTVQTIPANEALANVRHSLGQ